MVVVALLEAGKVPSALGGSVLVANERLDFSSVPLVLVVVALVVSRITPIDGLPLPTRTLELAQTVEHIASHRSKKHPQMYHNWNFQNI